MPKKSKTAVVKSDDRTRTLHLDVLEKDVKQLSLGDEVRILVTGKVTSLSEPYSYHDCCEGEEKREKYGSLRIDLIKQEIQELEEENEFTEMSKEDD